MKKDATRSGLRYLVALLLLFFPLPRHGPASPL
jgi:hypothetical protein